MKKSNYNKRWSSNVNVDGHSHSVQKTSLGVYNNCVPILRPIGPNAENFTVRITKLL